MQPGENENVVVSCSSSSTACTTTVTTTTSIITNPLLTLPHLYQQYSSSTPCLTSPSLYNQGFNFTPIGNSQDTNQSNASLSSNQLGGSTETNIHHNWQIIKRTTKRKKTHNEEPLKIKLAKRAETTIPITPSQYQPLAVDMEDEDEDLNNPSNQTNSVVASTSQQTAKPPTAPRSPPPPPPIFIYGVINFQQMKDNIKTAILESDYKTRALANNTIKINPKNADAYRALVKHLREQKIVFHTYQIKQDRAYRVVLRNIHHSIPTDEIKAALEEQGFNVRNIMNINKRTTETPLNLFFVDLEPADNNKKIYDIQYLLNMKISVEPPRKTTNIVQCTRCQQYGHTKAYCTRPFSCVKCGEHHSSSSCSKTRDLPATCALCDGAHPANYRGCSVHKDLQNMRRNQQGRRPEPDHRQTHNQQAPPTTETSTNNSANTQRHSYAETVKTNQTRPNQSTNQPSQQISLVSFLQEFKAMFQQLMSQNTMILNMLQALVTNMVQK